ncbi:MAG: GDP-mannose 4,6-dehydratase [Alphaproteobacteria bacterium]
MAARRALITGIYGQDAAYLAQFLLHRGYEVFGSHRRGSSRASWRLEELNVEKDVRLVELELLEMGNILRVLKDTQPDEIYNLAAQSFVGVSFKQPLYTSEVDGLAVTRLLEVVREVNPQIRFYQASTSEMFGRVVESPQTERTPFAPRSPYGISKLYAHWMVRNYREAHGMHTTSGILFNHESPLRSREFVTRKITSALAEIKNNKQDVLELGNLGARRDWGHARDYVAGMHAMVRLDTPNDYVLATGRAYSVEDFVNTAARVAGFHLAWEGEGQARHAVDRGTGRLIVRVNPNYFRPAEVEDLVGDASRAAADLGWRSRTSFEDLVQEMMERDLARVRDGCVLL